MQFSGAIGAGEASLIGSGSRRSLAGKALTTWSRMDLREAQ